MDRTLEHTGKSTRSHDQGQALSPTPGQATARVLVIRVGRLGDIVMATSVIEPIRRTFGPDVLIDWAASTGSGKAILERDPRINRVFPIAHRRIPWIFHRVKREMRRLSRADPYDLVINLEFSAPCDDFVTFVGHRQFCGRPLVNPAHQPGQHTIDADKLLYGDILEVNQGVTDGPLLKMPVTPDLAVLPAHERFVMLNPGFNGVLGKGYHLNRGWPMAHWKELIGLITDRFGLSVVLNGSPGEEVCFQSLLDLQGVHSMFGSSVPQLVKAVRDAECLVSVDTGTMHLGAAMGTPTVALFGPSRPDLTGPYLKTAPGRILSSNIECQPCYGTELRKSCNFNRCMHKLLPVQVADTIEELISVP